MSGASDISNQPGLILRTARDELGYSLDHVAHELHLRVSVVQSLENEDYSAFTSDVFLKGYFRSYCRLVNLHEERMVELLEKQLAAIKQECDDQAANVKKAAQAKVRKKATILVLFIAVVSSVLIYLFSMFGGGDDRSIQDIQHLKNSLLNKKTASVSATTTSSEGGKSKALVTEAHLDSDKQNESTDAIEVVNKHKLESAHSLSPTENKQVINQVEDSNDFSNELQSELTGGSEAQRAEAEDGADKESKVGSDRELQDAEVLIKFSGDCWLKFTNGEGKTVFAALKRDGQQVKYIGKAPFSIVLGDARQSTVLFNGEHVDLQPYTRKNGRAQFVLEPELQR